MTVTLEEKGVFGSQKNLAFFLKVAQAHLWIPEEKWKLELAKTQSICTDSSSVPTRCLTHSPSLEECRVKGPCWLPRHSSPEETTPTPSALYYLDDWSLREVKEVYK